MPFSAFQKIRITVYYLLTVIYFYTHSAFKGSYKLNQVTIHLRLNEIFASYLQFYLYSGDAPIMNTF